MFPAYITTIGLVASLLVLLVVMLVLLFSYHDMVKKFRYSQKENTFLKNHLHERSVEILDGARKRAIGLLEEAEKKASEIVASAQTYQGESETTMKDSMTLLQKKEAATLETVTAERIKLYTTNIDQTTKNDIKVFHDLTQQFEDKVKMELQSVDKTLQQEIANSQVAARETLNKTQAAAEGEINAYKAQRLAKIDERILELLTSIASDVFGKTLPLEEHERIVIDALETAKKDLLKN